ncbi:hypothetical protein ACW9KT_19950 [Hymenobacter sp. HD11105]
MRTPASLSPSPAHRQAVALAIQFPAHPFLTPGPYQHVLLDAFVGGQLTMDQVLVHLEAAEYASLSPGAGTNA